MGDRRVETGNFWGAGFLMGGFDVDSGCAVRCDSL